MVAFGSVSKPFGDGLDLNAHCLAGSRGVELYKSEIRVLKLKYELLAPLSSTAAWVTNARYELPSQ